MNTVNKVGVDDPDQSPNRLHKAHQIPIHFRWPVKQTGECEVELVVPIGLSGTPLLNPDCIQDLGLSRSEVVKAEAAVIRAIAIIPEG